MKKILILGVSAVQADAIKVIKELGYETYACAMANDGPGADIANHFEIINILDIPKLIDYIQKNQINAVYSVGSDMAMPVACKISEELNLPHFVSSKAATICNNKEMMRSTLGQDCKGNAPFRVIEDSETIPDIPMPYIMKPADSQGQRGIFLIHSVQEFKDNFNTAKKYSRSGKVIVEKFIDGPELSVNVYMVKGKLSFMVASDRETWPQYTGLIHKHIVPSRILSNETIALLEEMVVDACNRIGILDGPAYFQIKVEKGKPYIIEMTPRLDGCHMWKLLNYHTGYNILKLTFEHLLNQDITELAREAKLTTPYELEFFCQEPNTSFDSEKYVVPGDSLENYFYYRTGDIIRPVNNKFEKIGYFIRSLEGAGE